MTFLTVLSECWLILRESAAFILLGFGVAAGLHVLLARFQWANLLRGVGLRSVVLASAIGLPMPLCSCSVLPAAIALFKRGASKGATLSFLISTPETSIQSVLLTYGLLGPVMAIYRPIAAAVSAITAGVIENWAERRWPAATALPDTTTNTDTTEDTDATTDRASCCSTASVADDPCCAGPDDDPADATFSAGLRHAFVDVFDDVVGWLLLGVVVAAVINVLIPDVILNAVFGGQLQAMAVMLLVGIPLYVCAEASTPIAAALITQGVSPGAALVFLLVGPATNIGAVGLLIRQLGRRAMVVYLASIAVVSVVMGLTLDWLFGMRGITLTERALAEPWIPGWFKTCGGIVFLLLTVFSCARLRVAHQIVAAVDWLLPVRVTGPRLAGFTGAALLIGYLSTGWIVIQPDELGMVKRFGRIVRRDVPPGLIVTWPWPIASVDRVAPDRIRRLDNRYGAPPDAPAPASLAPDSFTAPADLPAELRSWVLLGDENIASVRWAVHWRMKPGAARAFLYGVHDAEALVYSTTQAAVCAVFGTGRIETVFTGAQAELRRQVRATAQAALDSCGSGIELVAFTLLDLHAPPQVHSAFRDVASALEDKARMRNEALTFQARVEPSARGTRDQILFNAQGYAARVVAEANGKSASFAARHDAYRAHPEITRARLLFEMYDRVLPGLPKVIRPSGSNLYLDLRYGGPPGETVPAF